MKLVSLLLVAVSFSSPVRFFGQTPSASIPIVITNQPFTAQQIVTSSLVRSDGTTITAVQRVDLSRASNGSTRRDLRILPSADLTSQPIGSVYIVIYDVPNNRSINLDPPSGIASVELLHVTKRVLTISQSVPKDAKLLGPDIDLGVRTIAGYAATGTRRTIVFPAGTRSPTQDVTQTTETWYSADLKINLLTDIKDSLGNSTNTALTQIRSDEPDLNQFTIPETYTVTTTSR